MLGNGATKRHTGKGNTLALTELDTLGSSGMACIREKLGICMLTEMNTSENSKSVILTDTVNTQCQRVIRFSVSRKLRKITISKMAS